MNRCGRIGVLRDGGMGLAVVLHLTNHGTVAKPAISMVTMVNMAIYLSPCATVTKAQVVDLKNLTKRHLQAPCRAHNPEVGGSNPPPAIEVTEAVATTYE